MKYGDKEGPEKELKKGIEKERPSSSAITSSQSLFKVEVKVHIKPYKVRLMLLS
jgi:hypothetical protein